MPAVTGRGAQKHESPAEAITNGRRAGRLLQQRPIALATSLAPEQLAKRKRAGWQGCMPGGGLLFKISLVGAYTGPRVVKSGLKPCDKRGPICMWKSGAPKIRACGIPGRF